MKKEGRNKEKENMKKKIICVDNNTDSKKRSKTGNWYKGRKVEELILAMNRRRQQKIEQEDSKKREKLNYTNIQKKYTTQCGMKIRAATHKCCKNRSQSSYSSTK